MAHAFNIIPAKPTFGTLRENLCQSDYINRKKGIYNYCNSKPYCQKLKISQSYNNLYSFNNTRLHTKCILPINKTDLIASQYSKLDLQNVCTVSAGPPPGPPPSKIGDYTCQQVYINPNSTTPFYYNNTIDPLGELFGRTQCGELNYTDYMVLNPVVCKKLN